MSNLYNKKDRLNARCNEIITKIDILKSVSEPLKTVAKNPQEKNKIPYAIDQLRNHINAISNELTQFKRSYYHYYSQKALKEKGL